MKKLRYLKPIIDDVVQRKMVFIGGPRQVGKTTLALSYLKPTSAQNPSYLNWDRSLDKSKILKDEIPLNSPLIVLDEIHKYKKWRTLVKGLFDKYYETNQFIVTGSARLDFFRKGGDSLMGRYRYLRLHPFSLPEIGNTKENLKDLLKFGGFPEPFLLKNESEHRLWQKERMVRVFEQDLRDLAEIKEISLLLLMAELLPSRVGSPLSLRSLAEDLEVSQPTVERWFQYFDALYYTFRIMPFGGSKIRAVKKQQKMYLWDWSLNESDGSRFENFVASHLLKYCHYLEDTQGHKMEIRYLRDTDLREIDFVVTKDKKPIFAVECKTGERGVSPHISYFAKRTNIPKFYQVHLGTKDVGSETRGGRILPFTKFCDLEELV